MFFIVLTLTAMLGVVGVLIWIGCLRVAAHLRDKPEATGQIVEHVLMPILGRTNQPDGRRSV